MLKHEQDAEFFEIAGARVAHVLTKVFGRNVPGVEVNGDDVTDWSIDVDGCVSIYRGIDTNDDEALENLNVEAGPWQVAKMDYDSEAGLVRIEVGEPHVGSSGLDNAIIDICTLMVQYIVGSVLEEEYYEEQAAARHSWKPG